MLNRKENRSTVSVCLRQRFRTYTSVCRSRRKIAGLKACARRVGRPRYAERVLISKEKCLFPSVCGPRTSVRCTACALWQGNRKAQSYLADPSSALRTRRFLPVVGGQGLRYGSEVPHPLLRSWSAVRLQYLCRDQLRISGLPPCGFGQLSQLVAQVSVCSAEV